MLQLGISLTFLWFLRLPMLLVWHLPSGKKKNHQTSKLHTSGLGKGLLRRNDPDHNFHNCLRDLESNFPGPSSHSHFLQHLNSSVTIPPGPQSICQEWWMSRDRSHASRRAEGRMPSTCLTPYYSQDCALMVIPLSFCCENSCQIPLPGNHSITTLKTNNL